MFLPLSTIEALSSRSSPAKTTIAVCTGPDCRVDGASDCLRKLQRRIASQDDLKSAIKVTGRDCVGPCGDGPCVMISDADTNRVDVPQSSKTQFSLVEPDLFASNPKGWYQVRTEQQVEEVMTIAAQAANVEYTPEEEALSSETVYVNSSRAWFDRPRNERKVLQRLMQVLIYAGLFKYEGGEPGNVQYGIAFGLWVLSEFIMKENIFNSLLPKILNKVK